MLNRDPAEQAPLLAVDQLAQQEPATDAIARLPKDVQKLLLQYCAVQEIGRLAQVNKTLRDLINDAGFQNSYEVRSNFSMLVPDINGVDQIQTQPGYVRGSYAQLRDFFTGRDSEEQRLAELEAGCCINRMNGDDLCCDNKFGIGMGLAGCTFFTGFSILFYLKLEAGSKLCALLFTAPLAGFYCLICMGNTICLCAGKRIVRNRNERDALQSQLTGVPGPASLQGTMFSWQPTVVHQERAPAVLRMNE